MSEESKSAFIRRDRILYLRRQRVVLDEDLASIYGITTKRLNERIRRNRDRFPEDFVFLPSDREVADLRSQNATSSYGGRRYRPYAFTEHGAVMAANVLNSPVAIQVSVLVVLAFIKLREAFIDQSDLKRRLLEIERRVAKGFSELQKPEPPKENQLGFGERELNTSALLKINLRRPLHPRIRRSQRRHEDLMHCLRLMRIPGELEVGCGAGVLCYDAGKSQVECRAN